MAPDDEPHRWLDRTPWAQHALGVLFVACVGLPSYTTVPPRWAYGGAILVIVAVLLLNGGGPRWPRKWPTTSGGR